MNQHPKNSQGIALLLTIIVMGIVIIIVIAISQLAIVELRLVGGIEDSYVAYYAAETGLEKALLYFKDNPEIEEESFSQGDLPKGSYRYTITPQDGNVYIAASGFSESNWGGVSRKLDLNLKQGPIAIWHFDEGKGNIAYDDSGNDFDITIYDDEDDSWVEGISGGALSFDGEDDYGAIDGLYYNIAGQIKALTVSAWVKLPPDDPNRGNWSIVDFDRSEYFSCIAGIPKTSYHGHGDYVGFHTTDQREKTHYMWSDAKIADGNWHHIVWVFDSTEQHDKKIYIDGKLDASTNGHGGNNLGYGDDVRYGFVGDGSEAYNFNGSRNEIYFKGTIDEVRIYHRALDKKEIEKLYSLYLQ